MKKTIISIMAILSLVICMTTIIISSYSIHISNKTAKIIANRSVLSVENRKDTKMQVDTNWEGNVTRIGEGTVYRYGENCVLLDNTDKLYTISIQEDGKIKKNECIGSSVDDVSITEDEIYFVIDGTLYYKSMKTN